MPSYFTDVVSDLDELQAGIFIDVETDSSTIEALPGREHTQTFQQIRANNASLLSDEWISFYDYGMNRYGALNYRSGLSWSRSGQPQYIGQGSLPDSIAVQIGSTINHHSRTEGEVIRSEELSYKIIGLSDSWEVGLDGRFVSLSIGGAPAYQFEPRGQIGEIVESEGHLILIERQGRIQILCLERGQIIFEKQAPEGSEYRRAAISRHSLLTYTQHYFERSKGTIVHQHHLGGGGELHSREIPLSGRYHLRRRGAEILFATSQIYCSTTAELLLDARNSGA